MSIPTSKILKANKSLVATASLKHMSPEYENKQQQSVSLVINNNSSPDLTKAVAYPDVDAAQSTTTNNETPQTQNHRFSGSAEPQVSHFDLESDNPYRNLQARDLASAEANTKDLQSLISEKDNVIKAQAIIIDMFQNNPLIVNKYIIATEETLVELIKLLTGAETVEIELADLECSCTTPKYAVIKKIFLTVKGEIYSIELCPAVIRLFETYKISLALVSL